MTVVSFFLYNVLIKLPYPFSSTDLCLLAWAAFSQPPDQPFFCYLSIICAKQCQIIFSKAPFSPFYSPHYLRCSSDYLLSTAQKQSTGCGGGWVKMNHHSFTHRQRAQTDRREGYILWGWLWSRVGLRHVFRYIIFITLPTRPWKIDSL